MNNEILSERELASSLEDRLGEILGSIGWIDSWENVQEPASPVRGFDFSVQIRSQNALRAELFVECKLQPRPAQFPFDGLKKSLTRTGSSRDRIPVLAAPAISERMAELCRKHGWSWFDLAGNCMLDIPDGIWIERSGLRSKRKSPKPEANLGTAESARIVRALFRIDDLQRKWTQRELQESCYPSVSLGLVNKVVRHLRDQAYLKDLPSKGGFHLVDPAGLLKEWRDAYQFAKHTRHSLFTLQKPKQVNDIARAIEDKRVHSVALASFSSAQATDPQVRGEKRTWIYVRRESEADFKKSAEAQMVDTGSNLILLVPEDNGVFFDSVRSIEQGIPTTSLVQTYVDVSQSGGRGAEAAEALLNRQLKPVWKKAGLPC